MDELLGVIQAAAKANKMRLWVFLFQRCLL
jgi:hypothetical protein